MVTHERLRVLQDGDMQAMYGPLNGSVLPEYCELGSLESIRSFASRWLDSGRSIDVLSLNAGAQFVGDTAPRRTNEGFELTVGVNHLGHFLLTNLLLPAVEASTNDPRIVVTASEVRFRKTWRSSRPHPTECSLPFTSL